MHKVDIRRTICLPVFDPCYKPNDRRVRLPLLEQQPPPPHPRRQPSAERCSRKDQSQKPNETSRVDDKLSADATSDKTEKKLKRVKFGKWRSLNVDNKERHSNNEESVTKGRQIAVKPT